MPRPEDDVLFSRALAHVLAMEGGYTDDPHDPGGPTNLGITLAEYARDRGVALTADDAGRLKADLKALTPAAAARIYRARYWEAARCPELPPALAFFHFDTAVNQGVGAAARMLQEAVGAAVDGVIGPETLGKSAAAPVGAVLGRYADIRRRHYRSLATFWRFGKGWLARVERTYGAASALPSEGPSSSAEPRKMLAMPDQPAATGKLPPRPASARRSAASAGAKWWGSSLTVWGAVVTAATAVLPAVGALFGLEIAPELARSLGEQIVLVAEAVAGLAGTILTIYGRARATTTLERRHFTLTL